MAVYQSSLSFANILEGTVQWISQELFLETPLSRSIRQQTFNLLLQQHIKGALMQT